MARLIFGCGYLGMRVARKWLAAGHQVHVMTRNRARCGELAALGLKPFVGDVTEPIRWPDFERLETVLYAVGFDRRSGKSIREVYVRGLENVLDTLACPPDAFIYISSTGVYGQTEGEWVDEDSPCRPTREGGRACLDAERRLAAHRWGARAVILRLAGLYGPGRIPKLQAMLAGETISSSADGYLNLIHVDDAAGAVLAAESRAPRPSCYVVADGHAVARGEFYRELARLTGAPQPRFAPPPAGTAAAERGSTNKRISNRRLVQQLQVQLQYPDYAAGLSAIVGV